jgi:hypothetical protein
VVTQRFVEPLEGVAIEAAGDETILHVGVVDQSKLPSILCWLSDHGVDLVSVSSASGSTPS